MSNESYSLFYIYQVVACIAHIDDFLASHINYEKVNVKYDKEDLCWIPLIYVGLWYSFS
jgi:hypothetical protein